MSEPKTLHLVVKHGKETIEVALPPFATLALLMEELEARTGIMTRKQKIMCSGRVISAQPSSTQLAATGLKSGAKIMLLAAAGIQSQGAAALAETQTQRQEALQHRRQQLGGAAGKAGAPAAAAGAAPPPGAMPQRAAAWAKTGIASLRDMQLDQLPQELFAPAVAGSIRVLDCGGNRLSALPPSVSLLTSLQRLRVSGNRLTDSGVDWEALGALSQLSVLAMEHNRLASVPDCLARQGQVQQLSLSHNQLASLPPALGTLTALRSLRLRGNRLSGLPAELGGCSSLEEADLSANCLEALPRELSQLTNLKSLVLDGNKLRAVPPELLRGCSSLATLSVHDNPLTAEQLRETPGFSEFDSRRRAKYSKQIDMGVLPGGFDEGADVDLWEHWK